MTKSSETKGFTLIELLIVIGVLGVLAAIILVAVDPAKRLKQARDARRSSEVNAILNAILNYTVDNKGTLPVSIDAVTTNSQIIGTGTSCGSGPYGSGTNTVIEVFCSEAAGGITVTSCADLTTDLVDKYISEIPIDPKGSDDDVATVTYDAVRTGYYVQRTANGRVEIGSCAPEDATSIKIRR